MLRCRLNQPSSLPDSPLLPCPWISGEFSLQQIMFWFWLLAGSGIAKSTFYGFVVGFIQTVQYLRNAGSAIATRIVVPV